MGATGRKEAEAMVERVKLTGPIRRIGTATLTAAEPICDRGFTTASWYRMLDCEPQTVALRSDGDDVYWEFEGTVPGSHLPSSLCGVPVGRDEDPLVGNVTCVRQHAYAFQLARVIGGVEAGPESVAFRLDDEFAARSPEVVGPNGRTSTLWELTMPVEGHPLAIAVTREEPNRWGVGRGHAIYEVTYRGEPRGEVRVRQSQFQDGEAYRAAEALVFGV